MVYQRTVFGPPLWNVYFCGAKTATESTGSTAAMFADDLNTYKLYRRSLGNDEIMHDLSECQGAVHEWGVENRVVFDAWKEEFVILDPVGDCEKGFRMWGLWIDTTLLMTTAVADHKQGEAPSWRHCYAHGRTTLQQNCSISSRATSYRFWNQAPQPFTMHQLWFWRRLIVCKRPSYTLSVFR